MTLETSIDSTWTNNRLCRHIITIPIKYRFFESCKTAKTRWKIDYRSQHRYKTRKTPFSLPWNREETQPVICQASTKHETGVHSAAVRKPEFRPNAKEIAQAVVDCGLAQESVTAHDVVPKQLRRDSKRSTFFGKELLFNQGDAKFGAVPDDLLSLI